MDKPVDNSQCCLLSVDNFGDFMYTGRTSAKSPVYCLVPKHYFLTTQTSLNILNHRIINKKQGQLVAVPWLPSLLEPVARSLGLIALPAIHRSILARLKRHLGGLTAIGTNSIVHFPRASSRSSSLGLFTCLSAFAATRRLIGKTFLRIKFLFSSCKHKFPAAIPTC